MDLKTIKKLRQCADYVRKNSHDRFEIAHDKAITSVFCFTLIWTSEVFRSTGEFSRLALRFNECFERMWRSITEAIGTTERAVEKT